MSLRAAVFSATALFMAWFAAGFLLFPDAPIELCRKGEPPVYCGKHGTPRTEEDYRNYRDWEAGLFLGMLVAAPLNYWYRRRARTGDERARRDVAWMDALSWRNQWRLRYLAGAMLAGTALGATAGYFLSAQTDPMFRLWIGGILALFPSFLAGLGLQYRFDPVALREQKATAIFEGLLAAAIPVLGTRLAGISLF